MTVSFKYESNLPTYQLF